MYNNMSAKFGVSLSNRAVLFGGDKGLQTIAPLRGDCVMEGTAGNPALSPQSRAPTTVLTQRRSWLI